jgi:ABC-2 type transport system permease protein
LKRAWRQANRKFGTEYHTPSIAMISAADEALIRDNSSDEESTVFWRLRWRLLRTQARQTIIGSWFRASLILVLSVVLWVGLFLLFKDGFAYIRSQIQHADTHDQLVQAIFSTFFFALLLMLMFSSGIIVYGALFRSSETAYLLALPTRTEHVFLHKFRESVAFSSWGFLLLGSPLILAYGIVSGAPWHFYAMLAPFLIAFVYIPAAIGAILCLMIVYFSPKKLKWAIVSFSAIALIGGGWYAWALFRGSSSDLLTPNWFLDLMGRLQLTEQRLLPNWWLSAGLIESVRGEWLESLMFLIVMIANALFLRQLAIWAAVGLYRPAYSALFGSGKKIKRGRDAILDRAIRKGVFFIPLPMRVLMVKDLRLFRRDPMQWSQSLIFFSLLLFYFLNLRRFNYEIGYIGWVNMVSFLNLSVVGLLMSTFTTRFVYPMMSLETQRFWLLGLSSLRRSTIVWSKFFFAVGGAIVPCSGLILLSDAMLDIKLTTVLSHQLTCFLLCVGLAGLAVGLGALMPNFREQSPSRIAAGFGGTLCLVLSTLYILVIVLLTALPMHFILAAEATYSDIYLEENIAMQNYLHLWLMAGMIGSAILGILATGVPLLIGLRAFRRMEF